MQSECYTCNLDPETKTSLKMYLFEDVQNVSEIRNNIMKGIWNCAVIKPSLVLDPIQVAVAANKAVVSGKYSSMVTRTVFAEILFNLSLTKNISQSLSKFGIETDKDMLLCFLATTEKDDSKEILSQIEGKQLPISKLKNFTNLKEIKTVYKLSNFKDDDNLLDIIVSRMMTKIFVSY